MYDQYYSTGFVGSTPFPAICLCWMPHYYPIQCWRSDRDSRAGYEPLQYCCNTFVAPTHAVFANMFKFNHTNPIQMPMLYGNSWPWPWDPCSSFSFWLCILADFLNILIRVFRDISFIIHFCFPNHWFHFNSYPTVCLKFFSLSWFPSIFAKLYVFSWTTDNSFSFVNPGFFFNLFNCFLLGICLSIFSTICFLKFRLLVVKSDSFWVSLKYMTV